MRISAVATANDGDVDDDDDDNGDDNDGDEEQEEEDALSDGELFRAPSYRTCRRVLDSVNPKPDIRDLTS